MLETASTLPRPGDWDTTLAEGVKASAESLLPIFYSDLKRIAHRERAKVGAGMTLQTTALVHEAYIKLRGGSSWNDDAHFIRAAALAMRHALVNHALERLTAKRGQGAVHVSLTGAL